MISTKGDIVTHLPPVTFGFRHPVKKQVIGKMKYNPIKQHYYSTYVETLE
jgi:hypothetical protein